MGINSNILKEFIAVLKPITSAKTVTSFVDEFLDDNEGLTKNQIVVQPKALRKENYTFDGNTYRASSGMTIEVYAKTTKECIQILDDVQHTLSSNRATLSVDNLQFGESDIATIQIGAKTMKILPIPITFDLYWSE